MCRVYVRMCMYAFLCTSAQKDRGNIYDVCIHWISEVAGRINIHVWTTFNGYISNHVTDV